MRKLRRAIVYLIIAMLAYAAWDLYHARSLVSDACARAQKGQPVADFTATLNRSDFKIVTAQDQTIVVARAGLGRYFCSITHDGTKIDRASVKFID